MSRLGGKVALVTGGAAGIGRAIVERFVAEGASVVVGDIDEDGLASLASERVAVSRCDVTSEADQAALVRLAGDRFGGLDIGVANAGVGWATKVLDHELSDWQRVIDISLTGVFLTYKHAGRAITVRGGGSLVAMASLNAVQAGRGMAAYCAAKGGVKMLTEVTALELGEAGVRVNAIAPGLVRTTLTDPMWLMPGLVDQHLDNAPLGRWSEPSEIAGVVAFLVSDDASFITGTLQLIDGGCHLNRYPNLFASIPGAAGEPKEHTT
ncbi:SDR family NAD(P)-dependent oxidoreductase [Nocardia miyunensis]|uniref:SDR family NAD(P)-dependent oxidoreductase n=1 Tax=Nocardia miyunensis TaxID=282684 RepID=UPI0008336F27|nr:SDR family NAD(P)-dependent oxidoreductase [Nocardia miyunensis]